MPDDGLLAALGEGLRGIGAVASPAVAQRQAQERADALPNLVRGLQLKGMQRAYDADTKFSEAVGGLQPSAFKTSGDVMNALKDVPLDVIAESPRAQATLKLAGQMQQREALVQQRQQQLQLQYDRLDQQREFAEQRAQDARASAEERARANLERERIQTQLLELRKHLVDQRGGGDPNAPKRDYAAEYKKLDPAGQTAMDMQAWNYINKGILPYRKGSGGGADRNDPIIHRAGEIARSLGMSPEELSAKSADFKANAQSLAFATKKLDSIQGVLESFHNNVETWDSIAKGIAPKLGGEKTKAMQAQLQALNFTGIKSLDEVKLRIQQQVNDPTVAAYLTATMAVAMDYARVMQGPQSAASLTEGSRHEAMRLISAGVNNEARKAIIGTLYSDTEGQVKGLRDQTDTIRKRLGMRATASPEEKKPDPTRASGADKAAVEKAGWTYEPEKYEYRVVNGKVQRRAKGG